MHMYSYSQNAPFRLYRRVTVNFFIGKIIILKNLEFLLKSLPEITRPVSQCLFGMQPQTWRGKILYRKLWPQINNSTY